MQPRRCIKLHLRTDYTLQQLPAATQLVNPLNFIGFPTDIATKEIADTKRVTDPIPSAADIAAGSRRDAKKGTASQR